MNTTTHHYILQAPSTEAFKSISAVEASGAATIRARLPIINGVAIETDEVHLGAVQALAERQGLRLIEDRRIGLLPDEQVGQPVSGLGPAFRGLDSWRAATHTVAADKMWDKGVTGQGIGVAVIDTGVAPHKDLRGRIVAFHDVVNGRPDPYDDHGHGTHVSGLVAGDGAASAGFIKGMAPSANIIGVKVLDGGGSGEFSDVIKGIQWAVDNKERYNIKVLNMSLGAYIETSYKDDPVVQAVEAAARAGITPVVAAGNSGPGASTVGTPGNAPNAVSVAAVDDRGTPWRWDDRIALFSSRGPTAIDNEQKPDLAAPGVAVMSLKANSNGYVPMSGTSMASPIVAGAAALLSQAHPDATPAEIRDALMSTAHTLWGYNANTQGKGCIDVEAADKALPAKG